MNNYSSVAKELERGNSVVTFTHGVSMLPLIKQGRDYVVISPVRKELRVGDIVLFEITGANGKYILHRLIKFDGRYSITRGDNCINKEKVLTENILGRVSEIKRKGKTMPVDCHKLRAYTTFWMTTAPVRIMIFKARNFAARVIKKIIRVKK